MVDPSDNPTPPSLIDGLEEARRRASNGDLAAAMLVRRLGSLSGQDTKSSDELDETARSFVDHASDLTSLDLSTNSLEQLSRLDGRVDDLDSIFSELEDRIEKASEAVRTNMKRSDVMIMNRLINTWHELRNNRESLDAFIQANGPDSGKLAHRAFMLKKNEEENEQSVADELPEDAEREIKQREILTREWPPTLSIMGLAQQINLRRQLRKEHKAQGFKVKPLIPIRRKYQ